MTLRLEREVEVYRDLRALLEERSPHADGVEQEYLDTIEKIVANMEADLAETVDDLEDLRGEQVFDSEEYVQRFTYAGKLIKIVNQSSRLIVDMADTAYLGDPYDVTLDDLARCRDALFRLDHDLDRHYRDAVDTVMRCECFGPSTHPDREIVNRHLRSALTEAGYGHIHIYGDAEERMDDLLTLARRPRPGLSVNEYAAFLGEGEVVTRRGRVELSD